ncbi:hypothetical protein [Stutzerimonas stutzeri]|uniref:hypothetical protein n=1 Tax=Stutzerimonas stutzeri TaxID=316 RepID=UPI003717532E
MTFNTGKTVPSTDPRDLYDNAENLDNLVNGADPFYADRLGKLRYSWSGMEVDFVNAQDGRETAFTVSQADKESRFQAFLVSSGYVSKGDYAANVVLEERNEYVAVDAATTGTSAGLYRPNASATLPLTLTGTWATDSANLVLLGDDVLRQELANGTASVSPTAVIGGALTRGEILDAGTAAPGTSVTRGYVHAYYPDLAGALRVGGSDVAPLNDERGYWSGLPSQDAWGDPANIGLFSASFNRNGAAYGSYSNTFGHDCVTYGTASLAGGAGSATGNPSTPNDAFAGYCSFAYGKNNLAAGQKCAALGEEHAVNTRAAMAFGYAHSLQPSAATLEPVGASAIGRSNNVTGQGHALGNNCNVADGIVIGDHIIGDPESVTIGYQFKSLRAQKPGLSGRGFVGINNSRELEHEVDIDLGDGQTCAITTDSFGSSHFALRGLNSGGLGHAILDIEWTNPNSGSAAGEIKLRVNGRAAVAFGIESDGSIYMEELKDALTVAGKRKGTLYVDAGVLKVQP